MFSYVAPSLTMLLDPEPRTRVLDPVPRRRVLDPEPRTRVQQSTVVPEERILQKQSSLLHGYIPRHHLNRGFGEDLAISIWYEPVFQNWIRIIYYDPDSKK